MRRLASGFFLAVSTVRIQAGTAPPASNSCTVPSRVKVTAAVGKSPDKGKKVILLTLEIEKGWWLFANPVGNSIWPSARTSVKAKATGLKEVRVDYPKGKKATDEVIGDYYIYAGKVVIPITLQLEREDTSVELLVKYQVMNDRSCAPPERVKLKVP